MDERTQELKQNINEVEERIQASYERGEAAGTAADEPPALLIVTKKRRVEDVRRIIELGYRTFGESYIRGFRQRHAQFPEMDWHYIGPLHKKYVPKLLGRTPLIHSVTKEKYLDKIERSAAQKECRQPVLIEVNVAGEEQKLGFSPDGLRALIERGHLETLQWVDVHGLMTMAPLTDDEAILRDTFRGLRELRDELERDHSLTLSELSMGMTNDYPIAVEEGATIVRVGTACFQKN